MFMKRLAALGTCLLAVGISTSSPKVHAASSAADGLYSAAQSQKGKAIYGKQCALCHNADLTGEGQSPALAGDEFLTKYDDQPISILFKKIQKTMPATAPGSLSGEDTAAVLAFMLSQNAYPAGAKDLPADDDSLKKIQLPKPAGK